MKPDIIKLLDEKINSLPSPVREVFNSEQTGMVLSDIAEKNGLDQDQAINLFNEIGYVLFKVTPVSGFRNEIEKSLGIDSGVALGISSEIYGAVFLPIKKHLAETPDDIPAVWKNYTEPVTATLKSITREDSDTTTTSDTATSTDLDTSLNEALNPNDILKEIESPTPSIQVATPKSNPASASSQTQTATDINTSSHELDVDALELTGKTLSFPAQTTSSSTTATTATTTTPIKTAPASNTNDVQLKGFAPIDNTVHPAQKTADKLENVLTQPTKTAVKEVYQVKGPDPYREPFV